MLICSNLLIEEDNHELYDTHVEDTPSCEIFWLFEEKKMLEIIVQHCLFTMIFEYDENLRSECLPNIISSKVVTVGKIQGGGAFNVIPDSVIIGGTFRAFLRESFTQLRHRIEQVCYEEEQIHNDLYFPRHELCVLFVDIRIVRIQIIFIPF